MEFGEHGLPVGMTLQDASDRLQQFFAQKMEDPTVDTACLERLSGGSSNYTFLYQVRSTATGEPRVHDFIVRWDPEVGLVEPYDMGYQFHVMAAIQDSPVPMAKTFWLEEDPSVIGRAFYVVERVNADIGDRAVHHADPVRRTKVRRSHVETLAKIHAIDWEDRGMDAFMRVPGPGKDYAMHEIQRWEEVVKRKEASPHPVTEAATAWMRENAPETGEVRLLHGDCSGTNYMFRDDEVVAVIDWEMSTLGDPFVDIGWYLGCIETLGRSITGMNDDEIREARKEFQEAYAEITGRDLDQKAVLWGEVFFNYQLMSVGISGDWLRRQMGEEPMDPGMQSMFAREIERLIGM